MKTELTVEQKNLIVDALESYKGNTRSSIASLCRSIKFHQDESAALGKQLAAKRAGYRSVQAYEDNYLRLIGNVSRLSERMEQLDEIIKAIG